MPGRFFRLSAPQRRFLAEAFCLLAFARFAILLIPFRGIAPFLGQVMAESASHDPENAGLADRISWAVQTAARHTPWQSKCLAQAMAAKMMLKRRKVCSTLYLGLAKEKGGAVSAHAWLRCGERILTGTPAHEQFTVVAHFAESCP